jgi:hypothetical protein
MSPGAGPFPLRLEYSRGTPAHKGGWPTLVGAISPRPSIFWKGEGPGVRDGRRVVSNADGKALRKVPLIHAPSLTPIPSPS